MPTTAHTLALTPPHNANSVRVRTVTDVCGGVSARVRAMVVVVVVVVWLCACV